MSQGIGGLSEAQLAAVPESVREVLARQQDTIAKAQMKLGEKATQSLETFKVYDLPDRSAVWMHTGTKGGVVCVFKRNGVTISGGVNVNANVAELLASNPVAKEFTRALQDYLSIYGDEMGKRANAAALARKRT